MLAEGIQRCFAGIRFQQSREINSRFKCVCVGGIFLFHFSGRMWTVTYRRKEWR